MQQKLTLIIPCKDEQANIRACIESALDIADEVLVADSGSTDGTMEIARSLPKVRIVEREYVHSGDFKNWAIPQAAHEWILLLDADERASKQLVAEIREVLATRPDPDGFEIYRDNYFLGHLVRHCGWNRDHIVRLFRRDVSRFHGDTDHAHLVVETGKVGWLKGRIDHFSFRSYDQYWKKFNRYTTWQAHQWKQQGRRPSVAKLLFSAPLTFFKYFVVNLGFLDGAVGIQISMLAAFYSFMKQAKLWSLHHGKETPQAESQPASPSRKAA